MSSPGPGRASERHPAARARAAHLTAMGAAVARRGSAMPGPHRSVAAAALAVRGVQRRSVAAFASAYGVEVSVVEDLEAGRIGPEQIPVPLSHLTPVRELARAVDERSGPAAELGLERWLAQPGEAASTWARAQR